MGRPKPLLDVDGRSFLRAAVEVLRSGGCAEVLVVAGLLLTVLLILVSDRVSFEGTYTVTVPDFPGIAAYMDAMKAEAKDKGFVETIFGRRIHLPGIRDKNPSVRQFAERQAINAPIQGAAADIIRRAMIRMDDALERAGLKARMLLQVHDELVFEAPEDEADRLIDVVRETMSGAALPAADLSVPLVVEAKAAKTWGQAH